MVKRLCVWWIREEEERFTQEVDGFAEVRRLERRKYGMG